MILDLILILIYDMLVRLHVLAIFKLHMRLAHFCVKLYYSTVLAVLPVRDFHVTVTGMLLGKLELNPSQEKITDSHFWIFWGI